MVRALLTAAVEENAAWCDVYCRVHGVTGFFGPRAWTSPARTPEFYPDAVTLTPSATAADVLPLVDTSAGCSVKDSFATLELPGFSVLFEASWLHFPVPAAVPGWTASPSPDPSFVFLTGPAPSPRSRPRSRGCRWWVTNTATLCPPRSLRAPSRLARCVFCS